MTNMTMARTPVSVSVAEWVSGLSWSQIPPNVVEATKLHIMDILGVMLAGRNVPIVSKVRHALLQSGAGSGVPTIGYPGEASLPNAALVLGVMATALEFDDTHFDGPVHSTGPVAAAAFPLAAKLEISGRQLIEAVLVGNELSCRLGQVAPGMFHKCGFQATGAFGTFGAIYALGKILPLPAMQIVNAIGIGASMTASCMASFEDGTAPKSLHVGLDACAAAQAVSFAQNGISGPPAVFDGRFGFYRSHVQAQEHDFQFEALLRQLGTHWEVLDIVSKSYPCSYQCHPYLDAALELRAAHGIDASAVTEIVCLLPDHPLWALVCQPVSEKVRPNNSWHARVSFQHSLAEALVLGKLDKTAYSEANLADPRINGLADRIRCVLVPREANSTGAVGEVQVLMRDGNRWVAQTRKSRKTPQDFLSKFRGNVSDVIPPDAMHQTVEDLLQLERATNVATIFRRLSSTS